MKSSIITICKRFSILYKAFKTALYTKGKKSIVVSIIGFPMAFLPALIAVVMRNFSNSVQETYSTGKSGYVFIWFAILSGLYVINSIYSLLQGKYNQLDILNTTKYIKEKTITLSCKLKYKYILNEENYMEKIDFASNYAGQRVANSIQSSITVLQRFVSLISLFVVLFDVNALAVGILVLSCIPSIFLSNRQMKEKYFANFWQTKNYHKVMDDFAQLAGPTEMMEIRYWGIADYLKSQWRTDANTYINEKNKICINHLRNNIIDDIFRNIALVFVIIMTVLNIIQNPALGVGTFVMVVSVASSFQEQIVNTLTGIINIWGDISYMNDFFQLDNLELDQNDHSSSAANTQITFKKVSYTYPDANNKAVDNISVVIHEGEKIAIVGENGSGKTTFINLLCGLVDPSEGDILIGKEKLQVQKSAWRKCLSAVFQDFGRYNATIKENITISSDAQSISEDELLNDAALLGVDKFIKEQENGIDEMIGQFSEDGNNMSGGQWQKIAILRALSRKQAKVLILDEPTAALDPISEANLYAQFNTLTKDKTTILVTHRLGITPLVDRILVFKNGTIVEDGNHEYLMRKNGFYAKLYKAQAQWYT